jgi:transposase
MESCASAHWFARELEALGHHPRIIAPELVRTLRLPGKNDANDAAAICAAVRQPQLRFVAVKSADQQARLVVPHSSPCTSAKRHENQVHLSQPCPSQAA